jgi:hypothetical protein
MSLSQTLTRACPRCQTQNTYEHHASIHLDGGAATEAVLQNTFNSCRCAGCGAQLRFESDVLVVDRARDAYFQVVARDEDVAPTLETFRAMSAAGARLRVVESRDALVEKVRVWLAGLDDVAYECVKFAMRINQGDLAGTLTLRFDRVEGDNLLFFARRPDGASGVLPMPMHVYHRMASELNTAAYAGEPEVDERLARRLFDARRAPPAAQ